MIYYTSDLHFGHRNVLKFDRSAICRYRRNGSGSDRKLEQPRTVR